MDPEWPGASSGADWLLQAGTGPVASSVMNAAPSVGRNFTTVDCVNYVKILCDIKKTRVAF